MPSFNSYGEWTEVGTNSDDDSFYIDLERISKKDGNVYYWMYFNMSSWLPILGNKIDEASGVW